MHRRSFLVAGLGSFVFMACSKSPAPDTINAEGRAAYLALMKLKSAIEVGTTYPQYNAQLIEAHAEAELFLNQPTSPRNALLATPLKSALESFLTLGKVLQVQHESGGAGVSSGNMYYDRLLRVYPPAADLAADMNTTERIRFRPVLQQIFDEANAALELATQVVQDNPPPSASQR